MKRTLLATCFSVCLSIGGFTQVMVEDINPGAGHSFPRAYTVLNNTLFFSATSDTSAEIYSYDGSTLTLIPDANTDPGLIPANFYLFNNKIVFNYANQSNGNTEGLWEFDGTNTPTLIADLNPSGADGYNRLPFEYNGKLYFAGNNGTDGFELWEYDGTNAPTMLADINTTGTGQGNSNPTSMTLFQGKLFFTAYDGSSTNLYSYDGTNPVNLEVADVMNSNTWGYSFPEVNNKIYFAKLTNQADYQSGTIYEYDGTNTPTPVVTNLGAGESHYATGVLSTHFGTLYFEVTEAATGAGGRWEYDFVNPSQPRDANVSGIELGAIEVNNELYFNGLDATLGRELIKYDGTTATTLTDINTSGNSVYGFPIYFQNRFFIGATDGVSGYELWDIDPNSLEVSEIDKNAAVIYPNPAHDFITIRGTDNLESVEIYTMTGALVQRASEQQVNITQLTSGVYLIRVVRRTGTYTTKLIKQ